MYSHLLYGDGVHDDTAAIQERIDSGGCELKLPPPTKHYLISRPLEVPSHFRLVLPRFAEVRLAANSNCVMVKSKTQAKHAPRLPRDMEDIFRHILGYVDDCDPDAPTEDIHITGGVWNCNNLQQNPNPMKSYDFSIRDHYGFGMLFYHVKGLKISSLTIKDPTNYGMVLDKVTHFTVEDITFDYNKGNPMPLCMDGVHLCGNCHFGIIRDLRGACYDDMVAVNADDGSHGDISHITIDGLYARDCHSAVRLLAVQHRVENVSIRNVQGTFFQYCVGLTHYFPGACEGGFAGIVLENICAAKAPRHDGVYPYPDCQVFPLIWVEERVRVRDLTIRALRRTERVNPVETLGVEENACIDRLLVDDAVVENQTGSPMPFLVNQGTIGQVILRDVAQ